MLRTALLTLALAVTGACAIDGALTCDQQEDCPEGTSCLGHECREPSNASRLADEPANDPANDPANGAAPALSFDVGALVVLTGTPAQLTFTLAPDDVTLSANASAGAVDVDGDARTLTWTGDLLADATVVVTLKATDTAERTAVAQATLHVRAASDCFRVLARGLSHGSGAYRVVDVAAQALIDVPCDMDAGFTFAAAVDPADARWFYEGAGWTGDAPFGAPGASSARGAAFASVDVEELRVRLANDARVTLSLSSEAPSLRALFATGARTDVGDAADARSTWLSALPAANVQDDACAAGLNIDLGEAAVRIGVVGDNAGGDCDEPNSWVGLGGGGSFFVDDGAGVRIAAGNRCERPDDCDVTVPMGGELWVRSTDLTDVGTFANCADVAAAGWSHPDARFAFASGEPRTCP